MGFNYWQDYEEDRVYHLYNRASGGVNLFNNEKDYNTFLVRFKKYYGPYLDIYAYCLMPNHFHFLVKIKVLDDKVIKSIKKEKTKAGIRIIENEISINEFLEDQARRLFSSFAPFNE